MKFIDSVGSVVKVGYSLIGAAFTLGLIFLLWGVFNGFEWNLQEFATKVGYGMFGILLVAYGIYRIANRQQGAQAPKQKTEWDKL
ncbi:hypothetical protein V4D10_19745 [Vibrio mimicus]|uniref:hypothetical protein n=1 Tax=Vibrio mimicus TaxID=674 RepID=UPI002F9330AE